MTRFLPFRVTMLAFLALLSLAFIQRHLASIRVRQPMPFALPAAWNDILGDPAQISLFFLSLLLVLLIANEFSWRTARQNVIDGLSKEEWFTGKLLIVPMVALLFFILLVGMGAGIAALGPDAPRTLPLIRGADLRLMGGLLLCQLGYGAIALLIATNVRAPGSAIGVFFLYAVFVERLIGGALRSAGGVLASVASFLPTAVFNALVERVQWDPQALAQRNEVLARAGRPPVELLDSRLLIAAAVLWAALLIAIAFTSFRRRDL